MHGRNGVGETRIYKIVVRAKARLHTDGVCRDRSETEQKREQDYYNPNASNQAQDQAYRADRNALSDHRSWHKQASIDSNLSQSASFLGDVILWLAANHC